ncbi:hypothetical protein B1H26_31510 [Amycolatopsis sp. BJA-103]|nr:hypothetical protein [Amycolatopsis sp. BJA-103]AUI58431.1 hypothetical protein BKN51_09525 [Amycolatopsis sp. BJA-103]PNE15109.1 hypothetical protein B1H26_31510 [Amycolatopsis sp. BJA-103]
MTALERTPEGFDVEASGHVEHFDAVVLACEVTGLRRIVAASPTLGTAPWRAAVEGLRTAPPFLFRRLWLDRPVHADRPPFLGTGSVPPLDNISLLDRYEGEGRRWAARTGGSVVELHAYAATSTDQESLAAAMDERLLERSIPKREMQG